MARPLRTWCVQEEEADGLLSSYTWRGGEEAPPGPPSSRAPLFSFSQGARAIDLDMGQDLSTLSSAAGRGPSKRLRTRERHHLEERLFWTRVKDHLVIDPRSSALRANFDVVIWVALFVAAFFTPFEAAFAHLYDGGSLACLALVDAAIDAVFTVDIALHFVTGYLDEARPCHLETSLPKIAVKYVRGWFLVDLLTVLPGLLTLCHSWALRLGLAGPMEAQVLRAMRTLRLLRLMRINSFVALAKRWQIASGASYAMISLCNFVGMLALTCHWMACLWGGMAVEEGLSEETWVTVVQNEKGGNDEWYKEPRGIYAMSLYWAIMTITSIGYGDIIPQRPREYWAASICMAVMAGLWAYIIGQVCGVVSTLMPHDVAFKRTMDDLNWMMEDRKVPMDQRLELRRYFHESRDMRRLQDQKVILEQLSPMLQGQVSLQLLALWKDKISYMRDMDQDVLVRLVRKLRPLLYAPQETILSDRTLFVVRRGLCIKAGRVYFTGDVFGVDMIIANHQLRETSPARCLSYLEGLSLRFTDLMLVVEPFPQEQRRIRRAEMKLAVCRAVTLIGLAARLMRTKTGLNVWDLTEGQRCFLYSEAINGTYAGEVPMDLDRSPFASRTSFFMDGEMSPKLPPRLRGGSRLSFSRGVSPGDSLAVDRFASGNSLLMSHGTDNGQGQRMELNGVLSLIAEQGDEIRELKSMVGEIKAALAHFHDRDP